MPDAGDRLPAMALKAFGRIDGLINNAGGPEAMSRREQSVEQVRGVFDIIFFDTLTATLPIDRQMREPGSGQIVMTTSAAGWHGAHGMAAYSASKAAVIGLMRVIALEGTSKGVHANAVAPYALTGMAEKYVDDATAADALPELVAPVVSSLVSEACTLNRETLVAGAGPRSAGLMHQGAGVGLRGRHGSALDRFDPACGALMSAETWTRPDDGNAAFEEFLAAKPPRAEPI